MNKVFLPFLAALSALLGEVKKKAGKDPKAAKQNEIQGGKRKRKRGKTAVDEQAG